MGEYSTPFGILQLASFLKARIKLGYCGGGLPSGRIGLVTIEKRIEASILIL